DPRGCARAEVCGWSPRPARSAARSARPESSGPRAARTGGAVRPGGDESGGRLAPGPAPVPFGPRPAGSGARGIRKGEPDPRSPSPSTSAPSRAGRLQRLPGTQALRPGLDGGLIDHPAGVDVSQGLERPPVALLLLRDPRRERLLDDPAS